MATENGPQHSGTFLAGIQRAGFDGHRHLLDYIEALYDIARKDTDAKVVRARWQAYCLDALVGGEARGHRDENDMRKPYDVWPSERAAKDAAIVAHDRTPARVFLGIGLDGADRRADFDDGDYTPWATEVGSDVWVDPGVTKDLLTWTIGEIDLLCIYAGCEHFNDVGLLYQPGGYFPTLDCRDPILRRLANLYDAAQAIRGDDRRAYRRN